MTKTYHYIYRIYILSDVGIDTSKALQSLNPRNDETFEHVDCFMMDENYPEHSLDEMYLYILCDMNNPRYYEALSVITKSPKYVHHYLAGSLHSNACVIVMQYSDQTVWDYFLASQYSKMYKHRDILTKSIFMNEYALKDNMNNTVGYEKYYNVMTKNQKYFEDAIMSLVSNPNDEDYHRMWLKEFDDPINSRNEILLANDLKTIEE